MHRSLALIFLFSILLLSAVNLRAQVDELSDVTGLPIPLGTSAIYGQVTFRGRKSTDREPIVFVTLMMGGTQIDRRQTLKNGYYFFLTKAQDSATLLFEVDGAEVGRVILSAGISNRLRQDVTFDWKALERENRTTTGVISAKYNYPRAAKTEKIFEKAMAAVKDDKNDDAIKLFEELLAADPKDFFAWTMLGTIQFAEKNNAKAEEALKKAIALKPDFPLALINLGKLEMSRGDLAAAVNVLTTAVESEPDSAEANHMLGEALLQAKKGSLAVGFLNKALELAPIEKAEIHLRLAALYNGAGLKDRAVAEYKMFLKKVKDHPEKKRIEKYIKENSPK